MFSLFLVITFGVASCGAHPPPPNLVLIVADDLGWNDVGYHNPDIISPNIDALASSGIKLNQSYVQPLCSPSRSAFMTGVYPFRMGMQHLVITPRQGVCVPLDRTFFPQLLKSKGYATHMVGKWHQGFCKWECTPTFRGFDSFYGFYGGGEDYYTKTKFNGYDFRFNETVERNGAGHYSTYQFADRFEDIINYHNTSNPLFLYLPFQNVHDPLQVPDKYLDMYPNINDTNRQALSAMVTAMDDAIGRLVAALKNKGIYHNTLIVFTSDNGGYTPSGGNNYPLRGAKATIFEGGTRVPAFLHGPMLQKTGVTYDGMIHAVDWFPTLAKALGIRYTDCDQDGVDQWEAITTLSDSKRTEVVYNLDYSDYPVQGRSAIRVGDYKLIEGYPGGYQDWYQPGASDQGPPLLNQDISNSVNATYLFNLKDDPTEENNLYDQTPDVVKSLQTRLEEHKQRYIPPNFPADNPLADPANYGGVWSPGWC